MRAALTLFHERNFALLFGGRCVNFLGNAMAPVALAFAILELTDSASALGLVLAARMIPQIILLLVGGVISDRFPRHRVLMGSSIVAGASQLGVAVLLIGGWAELWQIVILEIINGGAAALFYPADSSVVPLTVPKSRIQEANAVLGLGRNVMMIAGAGLAGLLVALTNPGWTIFVDSLTFFAGAAFVAGMRGISAAAGASSSIIRDLKEGWGEFTAHRWLWTIVLQFSVMLIGFMGGFLVLGPVVADNEMDGATSWAFIVGAQSLGLLVGGAILVRWRASRPIFVATLAVFVHALPLVAMALDAPVALVVLAAFAMGICFEIFGVFWYTALHEHVAPEALARVSSYDALGSLALSPLGLIAAGPLSEWIGVDATLWICAALIVVPTALVLMVPEVRNLRAKPRVHEVDVGAAAEAAAG